MPHSHLVTVALTFAALAASTASAAAAPPFPHSYRGTITGSLSQRGDSNTRKASWTIKGVQLRLIKRSVKKSDADWSAHYEVRGGTISYHETQTGACSYTLDVSLPLKGSLSSYSAPFALSQSLFFNHKTTALGLMNVKKKFKTTQTCKGFDGAPDDQSTVTLALPTLFDAGERVVKLGRRFAAKNGFSDDFTHRMTKWSWVLNP